MSAQGPLDLEVLGQLRALPGSRGGSLADDAIDAFLRELPPRLSVLRDAVAQSDWRTAEHGAQALRGISTTLGARDVVRIATELAVALSEGAVGDVGLIMLRLVKAGSEAMKALKKQRGPTPGKPAP
jgi:HPt (histidine-containing phosphotransfer) domain-containing protein